MKKTIFGMPVKYRKEKLSNKGLCGYFDTEKKEIVLCNTLKGDELKQTQLHEEFEAVFYRVAGHQVNMTNDAKEIMIDSFATWIIENYKLTQRRKK